MKSIDRTIITDISLWIVHKFYAIRIVIISRIYYIVMKSIASDVIICCIIGSCQNVSQWHCSSYFAGIIIRSQPIALCIVTMYNLIAIAKLNKAIISLPFP